MRAVSLLIVLWTWLGHVPAAHARPVTPPGTAATVQVPVRALQLERRQVAVDRHTPSKHAPRLRMRRRHLARVLRPPLSLLADLCPHGAPRPPPRSSGRAAVPADRTGIARHRGWLPPATAPPCLSRYP